LKLTMSTSTELGMLGRLCKGKVEMRSAPSLEWAAPMECSVTVEEAGLDLQERGWLPYFAGVFLGRIKKTEDNRYYI